ncbi:MAG TPA: cupin domain-containing protein [bacterium]|nr:cupin domain-containing protein [bacterium]
MAKRKTARKATVRKTKTRSAPARSSRPAKPVRKKTVSKKTAPKKMTPKKTASKKTAPKKTVKSSVKDESLYDQLCQYFRDMLHRAENGKVHLKAKEIPWERNRHALLRYYLHPLIKDTCLPTMQVFENVISQHGGMHRHQGGVVIFVMEGRGYSLVDGQRYDWEAGDLLLLPMKPGGVDHQHFNLEPDKPSRWLAFISNSFREHTGYEIVQVQESPEWKGVNRA